MTSVGYGDFGPRNVLERMVCTWVVLTSGLSWAYILGEVCAIVSEMTAESQRFRKKMHHLNLAGDAGIIFGFLLIFHFKSVHCFPNHDVFS